MAQPQHLDFSLWKDFATERTLVVDRKKILSPTSRVWTMGSCFAMEVRRALARKGLKVYPDYVSLPLDPARQFFDLVPKRETVPHYDTFVIRQEFESMFGLWTDRQAGSWKVEGTDANRVYNATTLFQEPYRKMTYATSPELLKEMSDNVTAIMKDGLDKADVVVLTLGLTEVWRQTSTGRYLCRPPGTGGGGGLGLAEFRQSTFLENYTNMKAVFDLLFERYPDKQVILTVSPVPLQKTFSKSDVGTANMESKCILRAVAGQICREYENVTYFPSYEMATIMQWPVFQEDGIHVLPAFADRVVGGFIQMFS